MTTRTTPTPMTFSNFPEMNGRCSIYWEIAETGARRSIVMCDGVKIAESLVLQPGYSKEQEENFVRDLQAKTQTELTRRIARPSVTAARREELA